MADLDLEPRPVLAGIATTGRRGRTSGPAGVRASEVSVVAAATITARKEKAGEVVAVLRGAVGEGLADAPRRSETDGFSITGIGPGQWLAVARSDAAALVLAAVASRLAGIAAVVDQSDSRLVVDIDGADARRALAKGIPIDLDPSVLGPGCAAQTVASHINLQIAAVGPDAFELVTARSTAGSLWHWLADAAAEFGFDVATL